MNFSSNELGICVRIISNSELKCTDQHILSFTEVTRLFAVEDFDGYQGGRSRPFLPTRQVLLKNDTQQGTKIQLFVFSDEVSPPFPS